MRYLISCAIMSGVFLLSGCNPLVSSDVTDLTYNPGIVLTLSNSALSVSSSTVQSGSSVQLTLILRDNNNNLYYQPGTTVSFSAIGGTSTGTFGTVNDQGNGTYTVSFTGNVSGTATTLFALVNGQQFLGNSPTMTVTPLNPGAATQLVFTTEPSASATAGSSFSTQPVVSAENGSGVTDVTYSAAVTLSAYTDSGCTNAATGILSGSAVTSAGVASFSGVQFTKSGTIYLKASSGGLTTSCSSAIVLSAGSASQLVFTQEPSSTATAGVALTTQPTVQIEDANNNTVSSSGVSIALSVYSDSACSIAVSTTPNGSASVLNAIVSSNASGASAFSTFTITDATALYVKAVAGSLTGCSSLVTIGMTASTLIFTTQPASTKAATFVFTTQPVVTAEDAYGNISGTFSASITLAPYTGSSCTGAASGILSGTSVTASAGAATFISVNYSTAGPIYLGASGGGLTGCSALISVGALPVAAVYPNNGANWNDYVTRTHATSGWTVYNQPDTACAGTEHGYFNCIHGGEKRKIVVSGITTCSGLTLSETLGAFDWICDASSGTATYYTRGLHSGMGLKNLVSATAFIANPVIISLSGNPIVITPSPPWWSNTVAALPSNTSSSSAPVALSPSSTIFTLSSSTTTSGYDLSSADKISVVTLGTAQLSYSGYSTAWCNPSTGAVVGSGGTSTLLCIGSNFNWIEGVFNGLATSSDAATIAGGSFERVHDSQFINNSTYSNVLDLASTYSSLIDNSQAQGGFDFVIGTANSTTFLNDKAGSGYYGFDADWATESNNVFYNNVIANTVDGFAAFGTSIQNNTYVLNTTVAQGDRGMYFAWGAIQNTFLATTATQTTNDGVEFYVGTNFNYVSNFVTLNNSIGVLVDDGSSGNVFNDIVATYNGTGISIGSTLAANNNDFYGAIEVGNNSTNCSISNGSSGNLLDSSCDHGTSLGTAAVTGVATANSFLGNITSNDLVNPATQSTGSASYSSISDWVDFSNWLRGWGIGGSNIYTSSTRGQCWSGTGTCQIYDYRLAATDTTLRNYYGAFSSGSACPSSVNASVAANVVTDLQSPSHTFLKNAVEVMDPSLNPTGNFDGLCESGETCIYTPNLGSYQGEGDYTTQTCTFTGGNGITGVTMYAYPTNGD